MKIKSSFITGLTISLLLGMSASSFAGLGIPGNNPHIGTEAGVGIVASPEALAAAQNFDYSFYAPVAIGTEAGTDIIAGERARIAAANYRYNADRLALAGTESGQFPAGVGLSNIYDSGSPFDHIAEESREDINATCPC